MKRFILVTVLISILAVGVFLVATPYFDTTKKEYQKRSANVYYPEENFDDDGYFEYVKISGKPKATIWAFGVFALLMSANVLYELYIVPKKKKRLESKV